MWTDTVFLSIVVWLGSPNGVLMQASDIPHDCPPPGTFITEVLLALFVYLLWAKTSVMHVVAHIHLVRSLKIL